MARITSTLMAMALGAVLLLGCAHLKKSPSVQINALPVEDAPTVTLPFERSSTIAMVSAHRKPVINIVDARPAHEKLYYPGETDPQRWRDAVTILPLETFQPDIDQLLQEHLSKRMAADPECRSVQCRITSFHVALDERNRSEEELLYGYKQWDDQRERDAAEALERQRRIEQQERDARALNRRLGLPGPNGQDDDNDTVGDYLAKGMFRAAVVEPIRKRRLKKAQAEKLKVAAQTLPHPLTQDQQTGWNCHIKLMLTVTGNDGSTRSETLSAAVHHPKDAQQSVEQQLQRIVLDAVEALSSHVDSLSGSQLQQKFPRQPAVGVRVLVS